MEISIVVTALAALAQRNRLVIYRQLVQAGPQGMVAGALAEALRLPAATQSFHLRTLAQAGLIHGTQEGRFVRYTADFSVMHGLIDYLSENCCGSDPTACSPNSTCKENCA
jgi:DNA-binding transcriptional ArsR family regulator